MMVVPFIASQVIANSPLSTVSGLDGVTKSNDYFEGGDADVKSLNKNIWDETW